MLDVAFDDYNIIIFFSWMTEAEVFSSRYYFRNAILLSSLSDHVTFRFYFSLYIIRVRAELNELSARCFSIYTGVVVVVG